MVIFPLCRQLFRQLRSCLQWPSPVCLWSLASCTSPSSIQAGYRTSFATLSKLSVFGWGRHPMEHIPLFLYPQSHQKNPQSFAREYWVAWHLGWHQAMAHKRMGLKTWKYGIFFLHWYSRICDIEEMVPVPAYVHDSVNGCLEPVVWHPGHVLSHVDDQAILYRGNLVPLVV